MERELKLITSFGEAQTYFLVNYKVVNVKGH